MVPLLLRIAGDPATTAFSHLIVNLLAFVGALTGSCFLVTDAFLETGTINLFYDLVLALLFAGLYGLCRFGRRYTLVAHLATALGLILTAVNFFINGGIEGPTLMVFLVVLPVVTLVHSPRASWAYLGLGVGLVAVCLGVQYFRPEWVSRYPSFQSRFLDLAGTFLFGFLVLFAMMRTVLLFFRQILDQNQVAQAAALEAEKLAALGTLLANLGHEISAPVGVIGSSLEVSREWWRSQLPLTARLLVSMSPEVQGAFESFLGYGIEAGARPIVDSRVARQLQASLEVQLSALGTKAPRLIADDLVFLGIEEWRSDWDPLVTTGDPGVLEYAIRLLYLERSNRSLGVAHEKILTLLEALKSYARSEQPDSPRVETQVDQGLDTVLTLYARGPKKELEVIRDFQQVPAVEARPDELIQVWTNLVQNALHAMGGVGRLTVGLKYQPPWVVVTVDDSGPGVPKDLRDRIFTPFFTTKEKGQGTGLGLGLVHRIVGESGGKVEVGDAPGGGARFTVRLPAKESEN
jgi:signal transduction histidine kinase